MTYFKTLTWVVCKIKNVRGSNYCVIGGNK